MTIATGCKCRVVVKIIYAPGGRDDVAVKTFVTSEVTRARRGMPPTIDWVKENTDFDEIFYSDRDYFLSNDLSSELGYKNSHFSRELLQDGYPYLSTIVWPIYGYVGGEAEVAGFLCVDTKSADAFDPDHDVVVGRTLSSFWYLALERYKESVEVADAQTDTSAHGGVAPAQVETSAPAKAADSDADRPAADGVAPHQDGGESLTAGVT